MTFHDTSPRVAARRGRVRWKRGERQPGAIAAPVTPLRRAQDRLLRHTRNKSTAVRFSHWAKPVAGFGRTNVSRPPRFPPCLKAPPPSCPDLFRASTFTATPDGRMDARNKSGHDGGGAFGRDGEVGPLRPDEDG